MFDGFFVCFGLCGFFFVLFKKERVFRLSLSDCGLSISCWVWCSGVPWKKFRVSGWYNLMTKACVLKVAKQPSTSPRSHVECSCCAGQAASAQQLFPFSQRRHLRVAQHVCKVLVSIRTTALEHGALGVMLALGSFVLWSSLSWLVCSGLSLLEHNPDHSMVHGKVMFMRNCFAPFTAMGCKWETGWQKCHWWFRGSGNEALLNARWQHLLPTGSAGTWKSLLTLKGEPLLENKPIKP